MELVWGLAAALVLAGGGLALYAYASSKRLSVSRYRCRMEGLAGAWNGLRILHITDVHGRSAPQDRALSHWTAELAPDLILITGDLVEHKPDWPAVRAEVGAMEAPLGIYYTPGNHEWNHGAAWVDTVCSELAALGVTILRNRAVRLERQDRGLWLAGVDDPISGCDDLARALADVDRGEPVVLLAHAPDIALQSGVQRASLVLAGHTHGGQICFPGGGAIVTNIRGPRAWMSGWHDLDGTRLFVSRGVGTTWLPLRLNCPAELPLIRVEAHGRHEAEEGL